MTKFDKLVQAVKLGKKISSAKAKTLLTQIGFEVQSTNGSHQTWKKEDKKITILLDEKELPYYLMEQISTLLGGEGL